MSNLTSVEKEILSYLQTQISLSKKITLTMVATDCHVAPSTIVKLSKKLGYSGFVEMQHQMSQQTDNIQTENFQTDLIEGELAQTLKQLALKIKSCENKKNIICSGWNDNLLAHYFSRKLQMFDIFAPASYDYVMTSSKRLNKGIAFFFSKNNFDCDIEMLRLVIQEGYYVIYICEEEPEKMKKLIDYIVEIKKTNYKTADFYGVKTLAFLEMLLSEYSNLFDGVKYE